MGILDFFSGLLKGSVGNNMDNDPQDVWTAKNNLKNAGYMEDDAQEIESPFITRKMDEGIKAFQHDKNLKVDGIMNPGGETERGLFESLTGRRADDVFGRADNNGGSVGFGGNVSGTFIPTQKNPKRPQNPFIFSTMPIEKEENGLNDKYALSLNNEDKKSEERQKKTGDKPVEYDATGRMIRDNAPPVPERKPETILPTPKGNEILDFVGKIESNNNYNVIVGGKKQALTKMTIKEVRQLQRERNDQNLGTAVGRYQIIDGKMDDLIRWMNLDENTVFDEKLQDKMGRELLRRRGFEEYKAGKITTEQFIKELSKEWASFPKDESNQSYYKGVGNNKALTDFKSLKDLLEKK